MEGGSDVSVTEAMIQVSIQDEKEWGAATLSEGWKSTLDDMVIQSSMPDTDKDRDQSQKVLHEHANRYNKAWNPVKTTPPYATLKLDSVHLTEHIESLQDLALVGRWHFPEMDDASMRKWLESQWKLLIGYLPIVSKLMKEWYCFRF